MNTKYSRGQAMTEYVIVISFCVVILLLALTEGSPVAELATSIKNFYSAYAFAISVTP